MTDECTLYLMIREEDADRYRRDGWTVERAPESHHSAYRQYVATRPVEAGNDA